MAAPGMPRIGRSVLAEESKTTPNRGPSRWIAALGYAGWGEGQLDEEMTRHGWFAASGDSKILFDTPTDERWAASFRAEGIDPRLLASETGAA